VRLSRSTIVQSKSSLTGCPRRPGPTLRRRKLVKELVAARDAASMSQRELAAEMNLQPGTVSKIEKGLQGLSVRNIKAIGRATGVSKAKIDKLRVSGERQRRCVAGAPRPRRALHRCLQPPARSGPLT
jgi:transcriptional regulator with XRE-family HTH domain